VAENKAMLQLRHAYFTLQSNNLKILAGQSWDIISPLNPSTLNYPVLWGCGNIGYRRPQISMFYNFGNQGNTDVTFGAGFFRTIGSDLAPTLTLAVDDEDRTDGADDGTDAAIPSFQGILDVNHKSPSMNVRFGISGLWGTMDADDRLGVSEKYESWAVVGHLALSPSSQYGLAGEFYTGSNLGGYYGGIVNSSTVQGVESSGGWGSFWMKASPKVKLSAGYGFDDPKNENLGVGSRTKNQCIFGNVTYELVSQVQLGLELSQWSTTYQEVGDVDNFRVQTSMIFSF
jgi:hypothetical protein